MSLKQVYEKWTSINLVIRIIVGLVIGTILAIIVPGFAPMYLLGDIFVNALRALAPILVFVLIMAALTGSNTGIGSKFRTVILLYVFSTIVAAAVSVVLSYAFPVTVTLIESDEPVTAVEDLWTLINNLILNIFVNPVSALLNANYLSILFWAGSIGLILRAIAGESTKRLMHDGSEVIGRLIRVIIEFAPIGIMGIIYNTVSTNGTGVFVEYGQLIVLLVACMLIVMLVTNPLIGGLLMRRNPYPLVFRCLRDSAITAFFTRSSAANIPVNLELCERMGMNKDFYSVSIPLGATINMNGAAVTITVMTLTAAFTLGIDIPITLALMLCVIATIASCGASGVSGGSLLLIPLACSMMGISDDIAMEMVAIGFIIGVIQDSLETAINSSSDVYYTAVAEIVDARKEGEELELDI